MWTGSGGPSYLPGALAAGMDPRACRTRHLLLLTSDLHLGIQLPPAFLLGNPFICFPFNVTLRQLTRAGIDSQV